MPLAVYSVGSVRLPGAMWRVACGCVRSEAQKPKYAVRVVRRVVVCQCGVFMAVHISHILIKADGAIICNERGIRCALL